MVNETISIYTPTGKKVFLPPGSTPVDFAYAISNDIAHQLVACRVDGYLTPLRASLRNNNTVEAITARHGRPNPAWLSFVVTNAAKIAIYNYLHQNIKVLKRYNLRAQELGRPIIHLNAPSFNVLLTKINEYARNPNELYTINPRKFEELVAELLVDMGYDVKLTPFTRDGGRDILAIYQTPIQEVLTVVDCKRYSKQRPIGPEIIQRLLWVSDRKDNASHAMIATTSTFTSGAMNLANEYRWRLSLKDYNDIHEWLKNYGYRSIEIVDNLWGYTK